MRRPADPGHAGRDRSRYDRVAATALTAYLRFGAQVLGLAMPLAMMIIVDKVVNQGAVNTLVVLVFGVALLTVFQYLFLWAHTWHATLEAERLAGPRRERVLRGLLASSAAPGLADQGWEVVQGCQDDGRCGAEIRPQCIADLAFVVLLAMCMAAFSPTLALVSAAFAPFYVLVEAWGARRASHRAVEAAGLRSAVSGRFHETVAAAPLLRDLDAAGRLAARWSAADASLAAARCRVALVRRGTALAVEVLQRVSVIVVMLLGVSAVIGGAMTLGQYIAFNLLSLQLAQPILRLAAWRRETQDRRLRARARADLEERCQASPWPAGKAQPAERPAVSLQVRELVASTGSSEPVSFSVLGGGWLGVVGPSGCGKTTLLQTLAGARLPGGGQVAVNGVPVHRMAPAARSRLVRLLPQEPVIFSASLAENLALGSPRAAPEQVVAVARVCGLLELAAGWPDHLDTLVGVRGRSLSGGERQRVALARALLSRPEVLLLDEATSALDGAAERQLLKAIRRWLPRAAVVVVSHRPSSLSGCGQVLQLDGSGLSGSRDAVVQVAAG